MEWVILAVLVVAGLWIATNRRAKRIVRHHANTLSRRTGLPADRIYNEITTRKITPGEWAAEHDLNPTTFEPYPAVTRDQITAWCADQYTARAQSLEAQQVVLAAEQSGMPPQGILWKFHETQWPTVVIEASQQFGKNATKGIMFDMAAAEKAIRRAAPELLPLAATDDIVDEVIAELRDVGARHGWNLE